MFGVHTREKLLLFIIKEVESYTQMQVPLNRYIINNKLVITKNNIKNYFVISVLILSASSMVQNHAFAPSGPIDLGTDSTFGILANTYTNTLPGTFITGDVGYATGPALAATVSGTIHTGDSAYTQAGADQSSTLSALNALTCDHTYGSATDLSTLQQPLAPGVYCITLGQSIGAGGITLDGAGTYVFRSTGALNTVDNSHVTLSGGANSSNVFWTPVATTLGAHSIFVGNILDPSGVTIGNDTSISGRVLAFGGTVTTTADTITIPPPQITLSPSSGAVDTIVTVSGSGFSSSSTVTIKYDGNIMTTSPAIVTTNASGIIPSGITFIVPASTAGPHTVQAEDASSKIASAIFTVSVQTCSISVPSTLEFGTLNRNQIVGDPPGSAITMTFTNAGTVDSFVTVSGTDWTDSNHIEHIKGQNTVFETSDTISGQGNLPYLSKIPLNSSNTSGPNNDGFVTFGYLIPGTNVNSTNWGLKAVLDNLPFHGTLAQTITFSGTC